MLLEAAVVTVIEMALAVSTAVTVLVLPGVLVEVLVLVDWAPSGTRTRIEAVTGSP